MPQYEDIKRRLKHPRRTTLPRHRRRWTFYTREKQHETGTTYSESERFFEDILYSYGYPALALAIDTTMDLGGPWVRECLDAPPEGDEGDEIQNWVRTQVEQLGELAFTLEASPWRYAELIDQLNAADSIDPWPDGSVHICHPILDSIQFAYSALQKWDHGAAKIDIASDIHIMIVSMAEAAAFEEIEAMGPPYRHVPSYPSAQEFIGNWFDLYVSRLAVRPSPEEG